MADVQTIYLHEDGVGGSQSWPPAPVGGDTVTITGTGFGVAPNVVLYRTLDGVAGSLVPLSPPEGEIGTFLSCNMTYASGGGAAAYDNSTQRQARFVAPQQFRRFRISTSIKVPDGAHPPGRDNTGVWTWSTDSGWKPVWVMLGADGGSRTYAPDLCIPSHIGSANIHIGGNALDTEFTYQSSNQTSHWQWGDWNTFQFKFRNDPVDVQNGPATHVPYFTSANMWKGVGTKTYTFSGDQIGAFHNYNKRIAFSEGGTYQVQIGEWIKGESSNTVAHIKNMDYSVRLLDGSWANGDAAGWLYLDSNYSPATWTAGERVGTWPNANGSGGSVVNASAMAITTGEYLPYIQEPECYFDRVHYNSYGRLSSTSPSLTQAIYRDLYLAVQSAEGVEDYQQIALLGNASTLEASTKIKPKVATSWSATSVVLPISAAEKLEYTHAFVQKADGTTTAGVALPV